MQMHPLKLLTAHAAAVPAITQHLQPPGKELEAALLTLLAGCQSLQLLTALAKLVSFLVSSLWKRTFSRMSTWPFCRALVFSATSSPMQSSALSTCPPPQILPSLACICSSSLPCRDAGQHSAGLQLWLAASRGRQSG